jgi:membrane-bound lytic murein transglycosylase MltF
VRIRSAPEELEDEDILEMVNAGLVERTIVDAPKAEFWAQVLPDLVLRPDLAVRTDGEIAWAFRKGISDLEGVIAGFAPRYAKGTDVGNQKLCVRSRVGAIGVMQVMPATGEEMAVAFIRGLDPNVHAGTKYLRTVLDRYFPDAHMDSPTPRSPRA